MVINAKGEPVDCTAMFRVKTEPDLAPAEVLEKVFYALEEKGYNPVNQLVGYLLSGDPAYITGHRGARTLLTRLERDELLEEMVRRYFARRTGDL